MKITVELDPIVKLECLNIVCAHNTHYISGLYCNMKNIRINEDGKCMCMTANENPVEDNAD